MAHIDEVSNGRMGNGITCPQSPGMPFTPSKDENKVCGALPLRKSVFVANFYRRVARFVIEETEEQRCFSVMAAIVVSVTHY